MNYFLMGAKMRERASQVLISDEETTIFNER